MDDIQNLATNVLPLRERELPAVPAHHQLDHGGPILPEISMNDAWTPGEVSRPSSICSWLLFSAFFPTLLLTLFLIWLCFF